VCRFRSIFEAEC